MKYQLQSYDVADNSNRRVVAQHENLQSQDEINAWYGQVSFANQPAEGQKLALVPENHAWFIGEKNGPNVSLDRVGRQPKPMVGESPSFGKVSAAERKADAVRRVERIKQQQEIAEHLKKFGK